MDKDDLEALKKLLAQILTESYALSQSSDLFLSSSASQINNNAYLIKKILLKLPNYE